MPSRFLITAASRIWPKSGPLATELGKRIVLGSALIGLVSVALAVRVLPLGYEEGEPAPRTFRAPRAIQYVDAAATDALRQSAADAVAPVIVFNQQAQSEARRKIVEFFSSVSSTRVSHSGDTTAQAAFLDERYGSEMDTETIATVVALPDPSVETVARNVETLVSGIMSARILEGDLAGARTQLARSAELVQMSIPERYVVITVGNAFLAPTLEVDEVATEQAREEAMDRVSPVVVVVQEGQTIVGEGEIVTARTIELVRTLGGLEQGVSAPSVIAGIVLMALLIVAAGGYLAVYVTPVWDRFRDLLLLGTLFLGMVYATRLISLLAPEAPSYLMPLPLAAVLATLLVGARSALMLTVLTTVAGLLLGFTGGVQVVATLLSSVAAIVILKGLTRRSHLFYAGLFMIGVLGVAAFGSSLASGNELGQAAVSGIYGLAGGLITAVLMLGLLPFFEFAFGVTTDITLLELGSPSHPLLRRLMTEAPGTYSHSVMAANLAETAAEAIGANPLLARAGAYFHDVGKIKRPAFFVENQAGGTNPHDTTSPSLSARIITAHVREGVELANQYRLPPEVVDIVRQHHGTSVVGYFYDKASKKGGPLLEADFRYDGRRPVSREAALVMLADAAEAAVRALVKPTPAKIESQVRKVVRTKLDDHQLDETALTLADIETVIGVYTKMLSSVYHPRIEYPEPAEEGRVDADQHRQSQRV